MEKIKKLKKLLRKRRLMDILFQKTTNFLEYIPDHNDRLNFITNFSGSYGFALILKQKIIYLLMEDTLYKQAINAEIF